MTVHSFGTDLRIAAPKRLEAPAGSWRFLALRAVLALLFVGIWAIRFTTGCVAGPRP